MDEGPLDAFDGALVHRPPGDVERHFDDARAEIAHPFDLRLGRGVDRDDRARNAVLARGVRDALPRISGADGPHPFRPLLRREHGHGIGGAADLERVDRLQVVELEPDLRRRRAVPQLDERRARDDAADPFAGGVDLIERDGADGRCSGRHDAAL